MVDGGASMSGAPGERLALVALVSGALCIAFAPIFVRISELEPTATAFYRMALALPLFVVWADLQARGEARVVATRPVERTRPSRRQLTLLLVSGLFFAADLICWHWSIAYTSVTNATFLANLAPLVVTVVAWLLGERITRTFALGLAVAMAGALLLVRASLDLGGDNLFGDLLAMMTAFFYAGYILTVKDLRRTMGTARLMGWSTAVTSVVLLAATALAGESLRPATVAGWLVLIGLAWISQVAGQGLITFGLAKLPASFSSVSLLIQPVAAALLAWALLGEALLWWQVAGGAAVLAGIMIARRGSRA